ncbi:hypothetical protein SanaruYs_06600 [Chryseotalea sanaruensis]|uniref:BZIP transcription factor n=1 Tax=Chryseotalea sanaruensis TaxID=2482724 RepID=A0A401U6D4_9BACT|nr:hypothetical protein [Chryseotalea sanaruensis]GCC50445.1 hypothetical protein SanaruYs_06600 [Chryseotalea sanaruensis]
MRVLIVCISILSVGSLYGQVLLTPGGTVGTSPDGTVRVSNTSLLAASIIDDNDSPDNAVRLVSHWWPNNDSERDLGSSSLKWRNLFLSSNANIFGNVGIGGSALTNAKLVLTHSASAPYMNAFQITSNNLNIHWPLMISTNGLSNQSGFVSDGDGDIYFLLRDKNGNADVQLNSEGNNFINGGNLGIGTVAPASKLEVNGTISMVRGNKIQFLETVGGAPRAFIESDASNNLKFHIGGGAGTDAMNLTTAGNLGLGLISPSGKLHINTDAWVPSLLALSDTHYGPSMIYHFQIESDGLKIKKENSINYLFKTNGDFIVSNGAVHSKEVKVSLTPGTGPDYVFEPTYQLPSLTEIENYIKANKHLPEVPSAKEMETNGINLSEMNMLLLKKVEELTLYILDQHKTIEQQKAQADALQSRLIKIEKVLNQFENK